MQIEYKFNSWEGNVDRFAWMTDQVGDFFNAMEGHLEEMLVLMDDAEKDIKPGDPFGAAFRGARREAWIVKDAVQKAYREVRESLSRAQKWRENLAAKKGDGATAETATTEKKQATPKRPAAQETLVCLVRVPERVAQGMRFGDGSLADWCKDGIGSTWEGDDFDGDWGTEVQRLFKCKPEDRVAFAAVDAGFVEPGSDAERNIMGLIAKRADADADAARPVVTPCPPALSVRGEKNTVVVGDGNVVERSKPAKKASPAKSKKGAK